MNFLVTSKSITLLIVVFIIIGFIGVVASNDLRSKC